MFKGRFGMWVVALISFCAIQCLIAFVPTWFKSDDLTVSINVNVDSDLDEPLANQKINGYKLQLQDENSDVIITDEELNIDGYTKYDDYLYSPLVLYAKNSLRDYSDGFVKVNPNGNNCYKVDLLSILQAIEKDAEWESLGVHKQVASGPIKLYIPNKRCAYYNDVVELFYLTLNNGKMPTDSERDALKPRVDAILSKCNKVVDIRQAIYDEYDKPSKEHKVFIAPEYLSQRGGSSTSSGKYNAFMPVYFMDTVYLTADVYIKVVADGEEDFGSGFVDVIKMKKHFMDETGWRIKNSTFDLSDVGSIYLNTP